MHFALPRGSCGVGCGSVRPCYGKHARRGCYCYEVTLATISWTLGILSILSAMLTALVMAVILIYAAGPRAKIRPHTDAQLTAWRGRVPATAVWLTSPWSQLTRSASLAACNADLSVEDLAEINKQINDAIDGSTRPLASIHGDWSEPPALHDAVPCEQGSPHSSRSMT